MATPYFQLALDIVGSTQDVARENLGDLPVLVMATGQTGGRGRSGSVWFTADRALAASFAVDLETFDERPFSLIAGIAAGRVIEPATLKWPNDLLIEDKKVGGILVERTGRTVVIGFGLNLFWNAPPEGAAGVFAHDPGDKAYTAIGSLWGAELNSILGETSWPVDEYRTMCATIGKAITWEPDGSGFAVDVREDGGLVVSSGEELEVILSGAVHHIRAQ